MIRKTIMTMAIATVATISISAAASAGGARFSWGGWGHNHHHHGHSVRVYVPTTYVNSCYYYKKKWKRTGKTFWKKKYKACLILKY